MEVFNGHTASGIVLDLLLILVHDEALHQISLVDVVDEGVRAQLLDNLRSRTEHDG